MSTAFALPNISTQDMSAREQHWFTVNQSTSVIISAYLDYLARISASKHVWDTWSSSGKNTLAIDPKELPQLVDEVQKALHSW